MDSGKTFSPGETLRMLLGDDFRCVRDGEELGVPCGDCVGELGGRNAPLKASVLIEGGYDGEELELEVGDPKN